MGPLDAMCGYFFCGMNMKLSIPSFAMRLNSPTSTSKQIEVAMKFSGPKGMVFTFDNPRSEWQYRFLRGWNCSWISQFKEEDERLFFGGYYFIKVHNLRLIKTRENYKEFVSAIWFFDLLLTGAFLREVKQNKINRFYVENLMNLCLKKETKATFPPFIIECFDAFIRNKQQTIFDLYYLSEYGDERMNNLLFHSLQQRDYNEEIQRNDDDQNNMIKSEIFSVFHNIETLIIQSTFGSNSYSFSLMALLNVISQCNVKQIIIKSQESYHGYNWIKSLWKSDEQKLKKEYAAKNYEIEMVKEENEYRLEISKI